MKKTAWITDEIYLKHDTGENHPESIQRLESILRHIEPIKEKLIEVSPRLATVQEIREIHKLELIYSVQEHSQNQEPIDTDTVLSTSSFQSACMAVGAGLVAIDGIKEKKFERAFCAVRPPGHHATPTQSMGFCLFNNIAITAKYAQKEGFEKVMIIDFDVHHGNGTQDAFYSDKTVFYVSTHQAFTYPGSGHPHEKGEGEGLGFTLNYPLMPESTDKEILEFYHEDLPQVYKDFKPDILLVSAGYDLHINDPLAQLNISNQGIQAIVRSILDLGDTPIVFMLEGGYSLEDLGKNVAMSVQEMLS